MLKNEKVRFIDLFAGIGGFHYALHNNGAKCVFVSEWDNAARDSYQRNFRKISPEIFDIQLNNDLSSSNGIFSAPNFAGDITKIDPKKIPDHDILCAGFPCQPFSISGRKKGFDDTRGTLFFNVLEIIKNKHPKVIFLENVKHLVHHDKGRTLRVIVEQLENVGYKVEWRILNAKDFGLAQNRERIIIVANRGKRFDFDRLAKAEPKPIREILEKDGNFEYLDERDYTILPKELWRTQTSGLIFCGYRNKSIRKAGIRPNTEHLSRVHKQPNRIYHIDGTHPTIPSQESSGRFWIYDGKSVRKLTVRECYRLQGFPDNFILNDKISACYNQIGNAVAIPMIEAVYKQIKEQLL